MATFLHILPKGLFKPLAPYRSVIAFLSALLPALLIAPVGIGTQGREELQRRQDLLDGEVIASLRRRIAADPNDCPIIRADLQQQIQRYYAQFLEDRRTAEERLYNPNRGDEKLDQDQVRLFSRLLQDRAASTHYLGESPYLFQLHIILARCEEQSNRRRQAIAAYATALRYMAIELPTLEQQEQLQQIEAAVSEQAIAVASSRKRELQEQRYQQMRRIFADPDRVAEEADSEIAADAMLFRQELDSYLKLKRDLKEAERQIDLALARRERGASVELSPLRQNRDRLQREKEEVGEHLEDIRKGSYRRYHAQRVEQMSRAAYAMAKLAREDEALRRGGLRGRGSIRGGYADALEVAYRIDPLNPLYMRLLAEEYHRNRQIERAIQFTRRYIARSHLLASPPEDLGRFYRLLGQLYSDQRSYLLAAAAYERAFGLFPKTAEAALRLGELHFHYTGRWERAAELYQLYLEQEGDLDLADFDYRRRTEHRGRLYRIYRSLASIAARNRRSSREEDYLLAAQREFMALESEFLLYEKQLEELKRSSNELKIKLLRERNEELERSYYELRQVAIAEAERRTEFLGSHLRKLDLPRLLERLAWLYRQERRWSEALEMYRQILKRGAASQIDRARRNITSIQLTLEDGRERPATLPPDLER